MQADQLERINNEAREWFTLMQSGSVSELEQQHLQEWLQANSAHQHAYDQYEMIWQDLGNLKNTKELAALKRSVKPSLRESLRNGLRGIFSGAQALSPKSPLGVALASAAILVVAVIGFQPEKITTQEFATATGEVKKFTLEDGSEITLGAKSQLKAWATDKERHIILVSGQAFFKVAKNPERPFWVDAGETKVRVVGTQFDVRKGSDRTRVAVLEGIVNVSSANKSANQSTNVAPVVLTAGQQVTRLNEGKFEAVNAISVSELESWRNGRLIYLRASLADVVADANRYFNSSISLGSKNLADLKVTAAVSTNQIDSLTEMLSTSLPIVLERDAKNNIVIMSRSDLDNNLRNTK